MSLPIDIALGVNYWEAECIVKNAGFTPLDLLGVRHSLGVEKYTILIGLAASALDETKAVMQLRIDVLENALSYARNRLKYFGKSTFELDSILEGQDDQRSTEFSS